MDHIRRLGNKITIPIRADEDGFTGRECPQSDCKGYFKIEFGTGIKGNNLPCHCPYCGHSAEHDQFWTKDQIKYTKSVAMWQITGAFRKELKKLEFEHRPKGGVGFGTSMKFKPGRPVPIYHYREKQLETEVVCSTCTLRYAVYGVFAFCPDCGQHNSLQILNKNLEVVRKILKLTEDSEPEITAILIENAMEDCVSAFDGFGREICRVHAKASTAPEKAEKVSFQNLEGAKQIIKKLFRLDISAGLTEDEWKSAIQAFQKRHLLSHKMGVVDADYVRKSGDIKTIVGHKVRIDIQEVQKLSSIIGKIGKFLSDTMRNMRP